MRYINRITWITLYRDNFTCQECGWKSKPNLFSFSIFGGLEVHHIDGNRGNNKFENLVTLCKSCHLNKAHKGHYSNNPIPYAVKFTSEKSVSEAEFALSDFFDIQTRRKVEEEEDAIS